MLSFKNLEQKIGYEFDNKNLLEQSLTHSSFHFNGRPKNGNLKNYERMEFLGDRVLGLVIAEYLTSAYPNEDEGDLDLRFAQLVRKESCTLVAEQLNLNEYVILGTNEIKSGLYKNPTILGDVCEALIAALFLDGGMAVAKPFILGKWKNQLETNVPHKQDAKTALQEWAQKLKLPLPQYKVIDTSGPAHAPIFTIEVIIDKSENAFAVGNSKRIAEQKAATAFLLREKIWN